MGWLAFNYLLSFCHVPCMHCAKYLTQITSFTPHDNLRKVLVSTPQVASDRNSSQMYLKQKRECTDTYNWKDQGMLQAWLNPCTQYSQESGFLQLSGLPFFPWALFISSPQDGYQYLQVYSLWKDVFHIILAKVLKQTLTGLHWIT